MLDSVGAADELGAALADGAADAEGAALAVVDAVGAADVVALAEGAALFTVDVVLPGAPVAPPASPHAASPAARMNGRATPAQRALRGDGKGREGRERRRIAIGAVARLRWSHPDGPG